MRSLGSSMPQETRMKPSVMPTLRRSSLSMLAWVMTEGQVMMLSTAPRFSQRDQGRCTESMSLRPAAMPPLISHHSMPPWKPLACCLSASAFCGNEASPGYCTVSTLGCFSRNSAIFCALAACFSHRIAMVFDDCSVRNAVCGAMMFPCMFCTKCSLSSSSLVFDETTPPTVMLCPSKYLVVEWRLMSQPRSRGLSMMGVAKVASQTWRMPCFLAMAETASRSVRVNVGFAGVSEKTSLVVPGSIASSTIFGSRKSTKLKVMPYCMNCLRATRLVPPYEQSVITQWSPCARKADMTVTVAAIPVEKQHAPAAFSRSAIFCSSTFTVGFVVREYEKPLLMYWSMDSCTNVVLWWIGVRIAPVVAHGDTPACTNCVSNPCSAAGHVPLPSPLLILRFSLVVVVAVV
mmetsp:Transcript_3968/g.12332  ORF Transcript_3968/g.12332 Transcript_3968/m.12332 type:complete len:404 (-) Transcript_3968:17-1228(-)